MDIALQIAEYILILWWALVILLFVIILIYIFRIVLTARSIMWGVEKSIKTVEQNMQMPMGILSSLFWSTSEESDKEKNI